jgi:hypothetical protein
VPTKLRQVFVRQGDCVLSIAADHGIGDPRIIVDHPDNEQLFRDSRRRAGILGPGDILTVPIETNEHSVSENSELRLRVTLPRTSLRLYLKKADGSAMSGEAVKYWLPARDEPLDASTDGDGLLDIRVPATARVVRVQIVSTGQMLHVRPGALDPIDQESGVVQRLSNLNYLPPDARPTVDELTAAVTRFRVDRGLEEEGGMDDAFRDALESAHRS